MRPPALTKKRNGYTAGRRCRAASAIISSRRAKVVLSGNTIRPPLGVRAKRSIASLKSAVSANGDCGKLDARLVGSNPQSPANEENVLARSTRKIRKIVDYPSATFRHDLPKYLEPFSARWNIPNWVKTCNGAPWVCQAGERSPIRPDRRPAQPRLVYSAFPSEVQPSLRRPTGQNDLGS